MKRLLFDMSSVLWQNLLAGRDEEHGRKLPDPENPEKMVWVNSAEFGFENFVNNFNATLERLDAAPREVVMVFDGPQSKAFRQSIFPDYKKGRSHHPASYEEFDKLRERVKRTLLDLGALSAWAQAMEADDVLCYLSKNLKSRSVIVSNDGDMVVLHNENVDVYRTATQELNENKYGPFPHRFVTLYKALVGDPSDNFKGAAKFGPKAFLDLFVAFDEAGLDVFERLIQRHELDRLVEDVAELPSLQRVIDSKESVYVSYDCARMYPERINTMRKPLQVEAGMVRQWDPKQHDARLKKWYGTRTLVHAGNYTEVAGRMIERLVESPDTAFDIETSTPPESDEWLEAKKRSGEDGEDLGVDQLASELTGMSLTFGRNAQHTIYAAHNHTEQDGVINVTSEEARQLVELVPVSKPLVVHNAAFELSVLYQEWGKAWKDNGWHGFLPNVYDTLVMQSYVDENSSQALKKMSSEILGYTQVSYAEVTQGRKMNQLTAREAFDYGCDDTICTSALFNYLRFWMELEDSMRIFEMVGRYPAYLNALRFVQGTAISLEKMFELEKADKQAYDAAWAQVRDFLIANGWAGTVCPEITPATCVAAAIKEAYLIVTGEDLQTQVRTPGKLFVLMREKEPTLAALFEKAMESGDCSSLNAYIKTHFKGEPQFNTDSPVQMQKLLYQTLGLPVRLRQKPTDDMRKRGLRQGNPKGDDFALQFAIKYDADRGPEVLNILKAIQTMRVMSTRKKLYYVPYRHMRHWKTGLVHSNVRQFSTNTRRDSDANPNKQQLGKNVKHGHKPRIREVYVAHHKDAVVVSIDFDGQELRGIAEQSQDPEMTACFVPPPGQKKKDMHALTATGILHKKPLAELCRLIGVEDAREWPDAAGAYARWKGCTPDEFDRALKDEDHPDHVLCSELRQIGKKVNFTTEYGAQAQKLSETLIITPEEAQIYIDAKEAAFPVSTQWKKNVIAKEAHRLGYTTTMLGARRHLAALLQSSNRFDASKAERQGVNFKIQGSAAEQTKLAEARMWLRSIYFKYDAVYIGPVHDELVSSCAVRDLIPFLREKHAAMIEDYAGMRIPIVASISFGRNYGEQIEVGSIVDETKILEALRSLGFEHKMPLSYS